MPELDEQEVSKKDQLVPACSLLLRFRQERTEDIKESLARLDAATQSSRSVGGAIRGFHLVTAHCDETCNAPRNTVKCGRQTSMLAVVNARCLKGVLAAKLKEGCTQIGEQ